MTQPNGKARKRKATIRQNAVQAGEVVQQNGNQPERQPLPQEIKVKEANGQAPILVKVEEKRKYVLEALLIVFSVLLALSLNELRNYWQEKRQTRQLLDNVKTEVLKNKSILEHQHAYHARVLHNIDSALTYSAFREQVFSGNDFNVLLLAPEGIVTGGFLDQTAWTVAKSNNVLTKADFNLIAQLTYIYDQQNMVLTGFDELRKIYTDRSSQKRENGEETLKLMRKMYSSYITARTPDIIRHQKKVLQLME